MRKVLPAVVIGLGAFLLTMGLLLKFVAYPKLAVVPRDMNTQAVVVDDNATFFDADKVSDYISNGKITPTTGKLTTVSTIIGKPEEAKKASDDLGQDIAIWESGQKSDNNDDDEPMTAGTERVAFDRTTGEAVNCCNENIDGTQVKHSGLVFKFPFDTQPVDTYTWWDGNTRKAWPITYQGEEKIDDMTVYKFTSEVPLTKFSEQELPGEIMSPKVKGTVKADRYYSNTRTFYVQPATGVVIDRIEKQHQEFQAPGVETITALDTESRFTQETVDDNISTYKSKGAALAAVKGPASYGLIILGLLLMLAGLLLSLLTGRRRRDVDTYVEQPAYATTPAYYDAPTAGPEESTLRRSDVHPRDY